MKTAGITKMYANEVIITRSHLLPERLIIRPGTEKGGFEISFILSTSTDILQEISKAAEERMKSKDFELFFFEKKEKNSLPMEIPTSKLNDFLDMSFTKIEVSNTSAPYLHYAASPAIHHIDVIFHTYEE